MTSSWSRRITAYSPDDQSILRRRPGREAAGRRGAGGHGALESAQGERHAMGLTTLRMPQLGESVTEGTVDRWLKKEGELVRRDEPLVEVVTDKVNAEVPSPFEGRLVRIEVAPGETVPIGAALAELEVEGASVDAE